MQDQALLRTLTELDRWMKRQDELRLELGQADRHVAYYYAPARDVKKETLPARLSDRLPPFPPPWTHLLAASVLPRSKVDAGRGREYTYLMA